MAITKDSIKKHLIDSTAISTVTNTVMAPLETLVCGMSNDVSISARILGTTLTFVGMGSLYSKGRELSKELFNITEKTSEKIKALHDIAYTSGYLLATTPLFYYASGSRDITEIATGTIASAAVGLLAGAPTGYIIDTYRDFTEIEKSERLPNCLKNRSSKVKKSLATLITAGAVATTATFYHLNQ